MKIYLIEESVRAENEYARYSHIGTWTKGALCGSCGVGSSRLIAPLLAEWDYGFDVVGDFSWCGYHAVVNRDVANFLVEINSNCSFDEVDFSWPSKIKKKLKIVKKDGFFNEFGWLNPRDRVVINESKSHLEIISDCNHCGYKYYKFMRSGLVIDAGAIEASSGIFRVAQFKSGAVFVTESFADKLLSKSFTNIRYVEAGVVL